MKFLNKKGQIVSNLQGFVMAIVTIGVVLAIGLYVLQSVQTATLSSTGATTVASNATGSVISSLAASARSQLIRARAKSSCGVNTLPPVRSAELRFQVHRVESL